jgi:hypothetical protein
MSYCRFQNTVTDLRDCADNITAKLSSDEERARKGLIQWCRNILDEVGDWDGTEDHPDRPEVERGADEGE